MSLMEDILTREPINKVAAKVVNQCHCSSEHEMNSLVAQREQLRRNASLAMCWSSKKRKINLNEINKTLAKLNKQLKPFDDWNMKYSAKTKASRFMASARHYLPKEVFSFIDEESRKL